MAVIIDRQFLFGEFSMEPNSRALKKGDAQLHLANRPFQVLLHLIEHRGQLVTRRDLLDRFWEGKDVYDETLTKCLGAIRKALDDRQDNPRFIETRYSEGYRFIGQVEERAIAPHGTAIEIERTRGVRIIVEEEEVQEASQLHTPKSTSILQPAYRVAHSKIALALITVTIVITATALVAHRNRVRSQLSPTVAATDQPITSLAVLPFKNLSGDPNEEYFSDGLTESFITQLSYITGLKVISRSSVFTFKNKDVDPRDVGKKLGVAAVLEGSVRKSAQTVRVEVRLVSTEDGRVLWSGDSHDQELKDIFATQDQIACNITTDLRVKLCGQDEPLKRYTSNVEAYQAYLKGRYFFNNQYRDIDTVGPEKMLRKAAASFDQAIKIDPNYAPAYAGLSDAYTGIVWFSRADPKSLIADAKSAALKAIQLDDTFAEGHSALATVYIHEWSFDSAAKEYERALALNPGSALAHDGYATYLMAVGRTEEMLSEMKRAEELDPMNAYIIGDRAATFYFARHYDEAIAEYRKANELLPSYAINMNIGQCLLGKGLFKEAIEQFHEANAASVAGGIHPDTITNLAVGYAMDGDSKEANQLLSELIKDCRRQYVPKSFLANIYVALNQKDRAFEMLDRAFREHDSNLIGLKTSPLYDSLRSDARFTALLQRVSVPN